jgi:hypothetical protein
MSPFNRASVILKQRCFARHAQLSLSFNDRLTSHTAVSLQTEAERRTVGVTKTSLVTP